MEAAIKCATEVPANLRESGRPVRAVRTTLGAVAFLLAAIFVSAPSAALGQAPATPAGNRYVKASLVFDQGTLQSAPAGTAGTLGIHLQIEEGWHLYWRNSGEAAMPTRVTWTLPDGWHAGDLQWPTPYRFKEKGDITTFGYKKEVVLFAPLSAPATLNETDQKVTLKAQASWLVCKDICVPGRQALELDLPIGQGKPVSSPGATTLFASYQKSLPIDAKTVQADEAGFSISVTPEEPSIVAGARSAFQVTVTGLPSVAAAASKLQVFPYETSKLVFSHPVLKSSTAPAAGKPGSVTITLPYQLPADSIDGSYDFKGIIAFDSPLLGKSGARSVEIGSEVTGKKAAEGATLAAGAAPVGEKLTYREVDPNKSGAASESGSAPFRGPMRGEQQSLLPMLLLAFFGGMILNLMPCVLPILSIKVMGILQGSDQPRSHAYKAVIGYTVGVLSTFLVLASTIVILRGLGTSLGWGFQLQSPTFVLCLTVIIFLLALAFFDVYTFSIPFLSKANKVADKMEGTGGKHLFDGVLAVLLSTPCTAPFFGSALAFALTQPAYVMFLVCISMGLGLALPYVLVATNPRFLALLPAPGDWMYRVRELMGFFLFATVGWLITVLHVATDFGSIATIFLLLALTFAIWLSKNAKLVSRSWLRYSMRGIATVLVIAVSAWAIPTIRMVRPTGGSAAHSGKIAWQPFTPGKLDDAHARKETLFIDFTAAWCITCKVNELAVIETDEISDAIAKHGITPLKADWTTGDATITDYLMKYGAEGVPLYVVIPGSGSEPIVLPSLLTKGMLVDAFDRASKS